MSRRPRPPLGPTTAAPGSRSGSADPAASRRTCFVAVVDGHDHVRDGVARDLAARPLWFAPVVTYAAVADLCPSPAPDLVVLDVHLGRDDSRSLPTVRTLVGAGTLVLLHTAERRPVLLREAVGAGVSGLALKDDGRDGLLRCVEQVVSQGRGFSSEAARSLATDPSCAPYLSTRQVEALHQLASGVTRQAAAHRMGISRETLGDYLAVIRARYLGCGREVTNTVSLVREATRDGYLRRPGHVCSPGRDAARPWTSG